MKPYYQDDLVTVLHGDCIEVMRSLPDNSVHAVVTDPPYGLGFMGKEWDDLPPGIDFAVEALRVLKPGGHLLAFGGTRTWHRLAVAVEDAGFEIRDSIAWLTGQGFPKSLDVSKAIDKAAGVEREVVGPGKYAATPDAERAQGWGTALKPAFEPIVVGRKPFTGTVAANVLKHGTGALNIDATRVGRAPGDRTEYGRDKLLDYAHESVALGKFNQNTPYSPDEGGRWPTNVLLDESQADALDAQSGTTKDGVAVQRNGGGQAIFGGIAGNTNGVGVRADQGFGGGGGASRFFPTFRYEAKAPGTERPGVDGVRHPTVKPLDLMRWLVRLVTPPGGVVLEPFAGSGTTLEACLIEGFNVIGIEREADYLPLIMQRISKPLQQSLDLEGLGA